MQSRGAGAAVAAAVAIAGLAVGAVVGAGLAVGAGVAVGAAVVAGLAVAAGVAANVDFAGEGVVSRARAAAIEPMVAATAVASTATPMTRFRLPCTPRISDDLLSLCEVSLEVLPFRYLTGPVQGR
jgi:hypothetical protein